MNYNTLLCTCVAEMLHTNYPTNTAYAREQLARALALTKAVDLQVHWMNERGWGLHLYNALDYGRAPWQGQCLALERATHSLPGRVWRDDTRKFAEFYINHDFWGREAAKTVGSDKLLYRTCAEEVYLQNNPTFPIVGHHEPALPQNILLRGMLF